jgi:HTH-type transcriptional regulator/antitoxin HigA
MPTASYEQLLIESAPEVIYTERQYREIGDRLAALMAKGRTRTDDETRLMRLLGLLIADFDRRHALPPENSGPGERLRFLLEHSGKEPADLIPVFGQRSHVNEALNGKREISAAQARKLAKLFAVKPGLFI